MNIFDNGYLTEEEKKALDTQSLIYLAAANYSGKPSEKIYPQHIYKYCLDADGKVCRLKYTAAESSLDNADILWDDFINKDGTDKFYHGTGAYYLSAYLDDDGTERPVLSGKFIQKIPMELVGLKNKKRLSALSDMTKGVYFLRWVSNSEYEALLTKDAL